MSHALLLAAGRATRLGPMRQRYAKACVPVAGTTPLRFLLEACAQARYHDIWINTHFRAEQVRAHAEEVAPAGVKLHFLHEPELLGTGGTLLHLWQQHGVVPQLVANAKMFTDFDVARLQDAAAGTLVLHPASPLATFGGFRFATDHRILGLLERQQSVPPGQQAAVFTGLYRPHRSWLEALAAAREAAPKDILCLVRHGLMTALATPGKASEESRKIAVAMLHTGFWCEISTPERVSQASQLLATVATPNRA